MTDATVSGPVPTGSINRLVLTTADARFSDGSAETQNYFCGCCCSCMAEE